MEELFTHLKFGRSRNQTDAGLASDLAPVSPTLARVAFTAPALASGLSGSLALGTAERGALNAPRIRAT
jgi:hypothetical protein